METTVLKARNGSAILVRRLAPGDGPALAAFNTALSDESRQLFLPHAYDDATLDRIIARAAGGIDRTCIALHGDIVIGYFFLWDFNEPVPVLGIGIADAWQGQGLGRQFLTLLIDDARAGGRDGIELTTVPDNERAFALYREMGFAHTGDTDNIAGDGRVVRERVMFLALKPGATPPSRVFKPPA